MNDDAREAGSVSSLSPAPEDDNERRRSLRTRAKVSIHKHSRLCDKRCSDASQKKAKKKAKKAAQKAQEAIKQGSQI
jgi:hypothetical protein